MTGSPLAKVQGPEPMPAALIEARKRVAWRQRAFIVSVDDPRLTAVEREQIEAIGRRLYGDRA